MKQWRRWLAVMAGAIGVWNGYVYWLMSQTPERFAQGMAVIPQPAMMLSPFPLLWNSARGGSLSPGDAAPDFDLASADGSVRVKLSERRGVRPVVLVFGSYT